jgi:hypothetical protein
MHLTEGSNMCLVIVAATETSLICHSVIVTILIVSLYFIFHLLVYRMMLSFNFYLFSLMSTQ